MKTSRPETSRASRATRTAAALIASISSARKWRASLRAVRAERVRLDQLGARADVAEVHAERRSRARGGSPPRGSAVRGPRSRAARPCRRRRRPAAPRRDARGSGSLAARGRCGLPSRQATVTSWPVTWPRARRRRGRRRRARRPRLGDLAQRHRPADAVDELLVERRRGSSGSQVQPGATALTRAARRDPDDLVLQARAGARPGSPTWPPRSRRGRPRRSGRRSSRRG